MPELHIVAGPNGVGKTTAFTTIVPQGLEYVNADMIAKTIKEKAGGLNTQDIANQEAAKIFYDKAARKESFAVETNLYDVDSTWRNMVNPSSVATLLLSLLIVPSHDRQDIPGWIFKPGYVRPLIFRTAT
ncbi:MAG: hypothetical protein WD824_16565 [Cyclobacteriaceae bacterium]